MKVKIKIIPNDQPHADGTWIEVDVTDKDWEVLRTTRYWTVTAVILERYTPDGFQPIAIG